MLCLSHHGRILNVLLNFLYISVICMDCLDLLNTYVDLLADFINEFKAKNIQQWNCHRPTVTRWSH